MSKLSDNLSEMNGGGQPDPVHCLSTKMYIYALKLHIYAFYINTEIDKKRGPFPDPVVISPAVAVIDRCGGRCL